MKTKITSLFISFIATFGFYSCDTDVENMEIQKLKTYDEQYFQNLRDFKKSDHEISYAYYEGWSPIEGVTGYKDPASWGERMVGLPDSIDIVNLWMGIPTAETHPIAYQDMKYCQEKLGTRFVMHADASNYRHQFTVDGVDYDMGGSSPSDEVMAAYAKWIIKQVVDGELNGVDIDWEGWSSEDLIRLVTIIGETFGPKGEQPDMLLIVDYFSGSPSADIAPYCDYIVQQAYSNQTGFLSEPSNLPSEKMIYCESFGVFYEDGGQLMNYARWEPSKGRKGGCGVFYLGRNYYSASGVPYNEFREAIQIMNPAIE